MRDFFNLEAMQCNPLDLSRTYPALFLTRFITHISAPTFVLLAGVSAYLHGKKLGERRSLAFFLLTRGAWLILLDALVISPIWRVEFGPVYLGTLWAIGVSMIPLAALVWLPPRASLAAGGLIVVSHNLLDGLHAQAFGAWAPLWSMRHEPGALPFGLRGVVYYPVLPWIGIMAVGYGMGEVFLGPAGLRRRQLTLSGLAAIALFLLNLAGAAGAAVAQTPPPPDKPQSQIPGKVAPPLENGGKDNNFQREDGVIKLPSNVDPGMAEKPPETGGRMPVIPPPGSPGGNPSLQPK